MKDNRPSDTAMGASVIRAVHQLIDDHPLILDDPVSPRLLPAETLEAITADPGRHREPRAKGLRSHVVLRSRYAEDELREAVKGGVERFVNVGAGFDTFAFRKPAWAAKLSVVEVDHPASQRAKIEHFSARDLRPSGNTSFVSLDLEKGDLPAALGASGVDLDLPAFFACLGVLAYLTSGAIARMLQGISAIPGTRGLVLAFAPRLPGREESPAAERAVRAGEPWLSRFTAREIAALLESCGFRSVQFLSPQAAAERYFKGRSDLPAPRLARLCVAKP